MAEVAGSNPAKLTNFNRYKFFRFMVFHPLLYIQLIIQTIKKYDTNILLLFEYFKRIIINTKNII